MARTLSAALQLKQAAIRHTPYTKFVFKSKDESTTYDYSSRELEYEIREAAYQGTGNLVGGGTIILRNNDLVVVNLKGYHVEPGYGYRTGNAVAEPNGDNDVNEYSYAQRLWVISQENITLEGEQAIRLTLIDAWTRLAESLWRTGTEPYYTDETTYTTTVIEDILDTIITGAGFTIDKASPADSIIDTFTPDFDINVRPYAYK